MTAPICEHCGGPNSKIAAQIATNAALVTDPVGPPAWAREPNPIATLDLVHVGAAGARTELVYELAAPRNVPCSLDDGELLVVSNPVAMDAGGTWQLGVTAHWHEQKRGF